jgi:hypothetical protein
VFISDNETALTKARKNGINTWRYIEDLKLKADWEKETSLPLNFREGFWYATTSRFFAISAFSSTRPDQKILQIEGDVWVSPNFPFQEFAQLPENIDLAYPLESPQTAAASILYLRDYSATLKLSNFAKSEITGNSRVTDMTILNKIHELKLANVLVLPTSPNGANFINQNIDRKLIEEVSRNLGIFNGIFDSTTYGLYLAGEDPRNHRGVLYQYRRQENHIIYCDNAKFKFRENRLFVEDQDLVEIFNLHIHSKSIKAFTKMSGSYFKDITSSTNQIKKKRLYLMTLILILRALKRRINFE